MFIYGVQFRPQRQDHINKWNGQDIMKWREATSKNLAIVSTLVATVAFSAAFNVPGSYGSDGKANLNGNRMYNTFLVLDTIAMTTSVMATIYLFMGGHHDLIVLGRASFVGLALEQKNSHSRTKDAREAQHREVCRRRNAAEPLLLYLGFLSVQMDFSSPEQH